jgi:outer membrane protein assembly factor BamB
MFIGAPWRGLLVVFIAAAADWPRFRGPNGGGVAVNTTELPSDISPYKNVLWKVTLPAGHSSPVIAGDRIFLTGSEGGKRSDAGRDKIIDEGGRLFTLAVQRQTGELLWRRDVPRPRFERYQPANSPASPSAVTDGTNVFVFFGDFGLISYDRNGKERWRMPLGPFNNVNGHGSSPILDGRRLIMLCDQDTNSYLLAIDKDSGRVLWRRERPEVTRSYTTPGLFLPSRGPAEIIVPGAYFLTAYSSETGEKLWWIGGMSWQPKSTPIIHGDFIYAHWWENGGESEAPTETPVFAEILKNFDGNKDGKISKPELAPDQRLQRGFENNDLGNDGLLDAHDWDNFRARRNARNTLIALRHGGRGELTDRSIVWRMQKFLPNVPSPLLYDAVLYLIKDGGILTALNPENGQILKQGRLTGALDTYYASPVAGAGKIYLSSQPGKVTVLRGGPDWEILSQADFEDEIYATPAIVDNRIFLRTRNTLYCFGSKPESKP